MTVEGQMCLVCGMEIEIEQESDGRWIAEIPTLPGAMAYGVSRKDAVETVKALALQAMARGESLNQFVTEQLANAA